MHIQDTSTSVLWHPSLRLSNLSLTCLTTPKPPLAESESILQCGCQQNKATHKRHTCLCSAVYPHPTSWSHQGRGVSHVASMLGLCPPARSQGMSERTFSQPILFLHNNWAGILMIISVAFAQLHSKTSGHMGKRRWISYQRALHASLFIRP